MDGMTISDAADATGFSASALRFYESAGLISPARREAGYRRYGDGDVTTLRFIGRAKRLGLSLEEIAEVVPLLDAGWREPVQDQLRAFVVDKITETQQRTTDLIGLLGQLRAVAARLGEHTPDGMCDDHCGCTTDTPPARAGRAEWVAATLIPAVAVTDGVPIACTLGPGEFDGRIAAWQQVTATARHRTGIDGGVQLHLPRTTDLAGLGQLVADEQTCCSFFTFAIIVTHDSVVLDVTAPAEAIGLVHALVGAVEVPA